MRTQAVISWTMKQSTRCSFEEAADMSLLVSGVKGQRVSLERCLHHKPRSQDGGGAKRPATLVPSQVPT